jgi:hypothetical protein
VSLEYTVTILGAGASYGSGVPLTSELSGAFLRTPRRSSLPQVVQKQISESLEEYWREVFGWKQNHPRPTFEDHFTALDLAANTGHNLGGGFEPSRLRVLRRLSIHRAFEILQSSQKDPGLTTLVGALTSRSDSNRVVSLNWDTCVEEQLNRISTPCEYGVKMSRSGPALDPTSREPLEILKLHGSRNWFYCDICRQIFSGEPSSNHTVDKSGILLRVRDFQRLRAPDSVLDALREWKKKESLTCNDCRVELSARVATFSYSKAFGFFQFDAVWDRTLYALRMARHWIFVGYSLPEADFEFRHLLKTAELARGRGDAPEIQVVLAGAAASESKARFERFFGSALGEVHLDGLTDWAARTFG